MFLGVYIWREMGFWWGFYVGLHSEVLGVSSRRLCSFERSWLLDWFLLFSPLCLCEGINLKMASD